MQNMFSILYACAGRVVRLMCETYIEVIKNISREFFSLSSFGCRRR